MNDGEHKATADAVLEIVCGPSSTVSNEAAFRALISVFAILLAASAEGTPASEVDVVALAIAQEIAEEAHRLRDDWRETAH